MSDSDVKETILYRHLNADDAQLLVDCIQRVYGDSYPIPEFYQSEWVADLLRQKLLYSVVAVNEAGQAIGNVCTQLEGEGDYTADGTVLMVASDYRGYGVLGQLGLQMTEVYGQLGLHGLQLYALALHHIVQEQAALGGAVETGILPAYFSEQAKVDGYEQNGARVGAVLMHLPLAALPPRDVFVPQPYESVISDLYQRLGLERTIMTLAADIPACIPMCSVVHEDIKSANRFCRLRCDRLGKDMPEYLSRWCQTPERDLYDAFYVDLPLSDPAVAWAADVAAQHGYFFAGLILERCGSDRLRLQRYTSSLVSVEDLKIASEHGQALLAFILSDQQRVVQMASLT